MHRSFCLLIELSENVDIMFSAYTYQHVHIIKYL